MERLHPQPIAREEQALLLRIVEREGEHAVQPREHPRPPDAPAVEQHLGIAVGAEACALGLKLGADLAKIVDLAVVGNGDPLVEALHRLRAAAEIDDRQPPMAKPHPRSEEHTSELQSLMRISY